MSLPERFIRVVKVERLAVARNGQTVLAVLEAANGDRHPFGFSPEIAKQLTDILRGLLRDAETVRRTGIIPTGTELES